MKCKKCGKESSGKYCIFCGEQLGNDDLPKDTLPNKKKTESNKDKIPVPFQIWFIVIIAFITGCLFCIPALILLIVRIIKYPDKRKPVWILIGIVIPLFIGLTALAVYYGTLDDRTIEKYLKEGNYNAAIEYVDEKYDANSYKYYETKADIYKESGDYDKAAQCIIDYCNMQPNLASLEKGVESRLVKYKDKVSEKKSDELLALLDKIKSDKAEKAKNDKEKEELKAEAEKARGEAEQAKKDAEQAKKEAEQSKKEVPQVINDVEQPKEEAKSTGDKEKSQMADTSKQKDNNGDSKIQVGRTEKPCKISEFPYYYSDEAKKVMGIYIESTTKDDSSWHYIEEEHALFSKKIYYKETLNEKYLLYYGPMKDGKPDGVGVIAENSDYFAKFPRYIGNFSKGFQSGYGIEFYIYQNAGLLPGLNYEGYFKEGKYNGKGVEYMEKSFFETDEKDYRLYGTGSECWIPACHIYRFGDYKNGELNGQGTLYYDDGLRLRYEGEWKNDEYNGKGKLYEDGRLLYEGDFKNGEYDGNGTLYNEDGSVKYKGKFKEGDIK